MKWPKRVRPVRILRLSERERGFLQFLQHTTVLCTRVPPPFCKEQCQTALVLPSPGSYVVVCAVHYRPAPVDFSACR